MKLFSPVACLFLVSLLLPIQGYTQNDSHNYGHLKATTKTVCYASFENKNTFVPPPDEYLKNKHNPSAKTKKATFEVTYVNFSEPARIAFQEAVNIWESTISSDVPIRITAYWEPLGNGILGSAGPESFYSNFEGAQRRDIWYPVALAEKIVGHELNDPTRPDIEASFNSNYDSWYFGVDGATPQGKFDFVTIVLHEIGHGLGFNKSYTVQGNVGTISSFFNGKPVVYETFIGLNLSQTLLNVYPIPSAPLVNLLTGSVLSFSGPNVLSLNSNQTGKIYTPSTFASGSSISHLDENTYPAGSGNSLMTPQIGFAESIHSVGTMALGILRDIGWSSTQLKHVKLPNTESMSSPFEVTVKISGDEGIQTESLTTFYRNSSQSDFTSLSMTATGNPNEYRATFPASGIADIYEYYISVKNNLNAERTNPGKKFAPGQSETQHYFRFETGPDNEAPIIQHQPKPFVLEGDTELILEANISDNIEIFKAEVEYLVNDVPQGTFNMTLVNAEDSLYSITLTFPGALSVNDIVKYRIIATDNSAAQNISNFPSLDFIELKAEGLAPTQDYYINDFNEVSASADFYGDPLFSIKTESGFENGAIHTNHPYPNGIGSKLESEFVFQLRIPIRLKADQASLKFDEVVLVEPGDGSAFGTSGFFDYVIAEGSKDGGINWLPLANGYDSSDKPEWLSKFENSKDAETPANSTALGTPSLYRTRIIDMLANGNFEAGDEIVIRFRIFVDAYVHGWGWAIDNLKIQIDETPPHILHDQVDYILNNGPLSLSMLITDINGIQSISVDYGKNDEALSTVNLLVQPFEDQYNYDLDVSDLQPGDILKYRIRSTDKNGNESVFPSESSFEAPFIDVNDAVEVYANNFNAPSSDFAGNFFTVSTPLKFQNAALHSTINYPVGFGLGNFSQFNCILKKSILVNADNPIIAFREIALLDPNDYMVVEASKDEGQNWIELSERYNSENQSGWTGPWLNNRIADSTMYRNRQINLIEAGGLEDNDKILLRFRLFSNNTITGWGWAMDDINIQIPITGIESNDDSQIIQVFPNPSKDHFTIRFSKPIFELTEVSIMDLTGKTRSRLNIEPTNGPVEQIIQVGDWPSGIYLIKAEIDGTIRYVKALIYH